MVSLFMGVAIPVLFYLLLLAFGAFLSEDTPNDQSSLIAYSILLSQSIFLQIFRVGILGSRYTLFLESITPSRVLTKITNIFLSIIANPLILILAVVLMFIEVGDWHRVPQGFLLLSLQALSTFLILSKPQRYNYFMLGTIPVLLALVIFSSNVPNWAILIVMHIAAIAVYSAPSIRLRSFFKLPNSYALWFGIFINKSASGESNVPFILLSACVLILMMSVYSVEHLSQYASAIAFIVIQVLVLFCTALQLSINRLISDHHLFFSQYLQHGLGQTFVNKQYLPCLTALAIIFSVHFLIFTDLLTLLVQFPFALICLAVAKRYSSSLIIAWVCCIASAGFIRFAF